MESPREEFDRMNRGVMESLGDIDGSVKFRRDILSQRNNAYDAECLPAICR